nr:uncharacterized protein LOC127299481 [Lolium perenne]
MLAILRMGRLCLCLLITYLLRQHCLYIQGLAGCIQFMVPLLCLPVQLHRFVDCVCSCDAIVPSSELVIVLLAGLPMSEQFVNVLKRSWPSRSYFGAPHHVCKRCGASF